MMKIVTKNKSIIIADKPTFSKLKRMTTKFAHCKSQMYCLLTENKYENVTIFICYVDGEIAGWAALFGSDINIFVSKKYRRMGIGTKLIKRSYNFYNKNYENKLELIGRPPRKASQLFFAHNSKYVRSI